MSNSNAPINLLHQQGRNAMRHGDKARAASVLYQAAQKTTAREKDYLLVLRDLRKVAVDLQHYRTALTIDWYTGATKAQAQLLPHVPELDQARTIQSWAAGKARDAQKFFHQAATLYEKNRLIAHAAICHENSGNFEGARALWTRLAQALRTSETDHYAGGLASFNLARMCEKTQQSREAHDAVVASVHLLEEAADRYEQGGQRERAFDCYQVLIAIGRQSDTFEHVLEGYVNAIRILRQDQLRYYAFQCYEDVIAAATTHHEFSAAATLAKELALYAKAENMPALASHGSQLEGEMWQRVARACLERGAPAELAENALLAAVISHARQGQFNQVGQLYKTLAQLQLETARKSHYDRATQRYEGASDVRLDAAPLPQHLRQDAAFPEVWHVDLIEWEQRGSAAAACGDVVLDRGSWSEVTRRRAMLARMAALDVENAVGAPTEALLTRLTRMLGELELYTIISPLEHLYEHELPGVRSAVINALARFMYKRTFITIRAALREDSAEVRQTACHTLEALRFPHAYDPLARIYRDASETLVRVSALGALARIDTTEAAELVFAVFQNDGPPEQEAAATALKLARGSKFFSIARENLGRLDERAQTTVRAVFQARGERL